MKKLLILTVLMFLFSGCTNNQVVEENIIKEKGITDVKRQEHKKNCIKIFKKDFPEHADNSTIYYTRAFFSDDAILDKHIKKNMCSIKSQEYKIIKGWEKENTYMPDKKLCKGGAKYFEFYIK